MQCFTSICSLLHFMHFLPLIKSPHPQDQQCQQHQQCNPTEYRPTNNPTLPPTALMWLRHWCRRWGCGFDYNREMPLFVSQTLVARHHLCEVYTPI
ncbi:hypothetical protein HanRHA438_Chr16g0755471 [Helianthus annuus]|nr:hypothetical protein HanRHA438_Chr16g0755471 [Helianthus annuus]